jgi:tRNA A37 threonylcarbamoyladenosine modification protein TsaB
VYGVCSLDVVAFAVDRTDVDGPFAVATDARRKEVYWAAYDHPAVRSAGPFVARPAEAAAQLGGVPVAGRGAAMYPDSFPERIAPDYPGAGDLASMVVSGAARVLPPEPLYLRRPDVAEPGARKRVS